MEYYPVEGRGVDIERSVKINGETPFLGAETLTFARLWADKNEVHQDNQGNDIRPTQIEAPAWTSGWFKDDMGYEAEPYYFWFEKGDNTIALEAVNEPAAIKSLVLTGGREVLDYSQYRDQVPDITAQATGYECVIQGEDSSLRSSPSLYATCDRSSGTTQPLSVSKTG